MSTGVVPVSASPSTAGSTTENLPAKHSGRFVLPPNQPHVFAHGKVDPVEAGRRGGLSSGLSRRLRHQRALEQRILEARNGAAHFALLRVRMERERDLERAR